ncbi:MAG: hypothetical protein ACPL5I_14150 [Thermodesulfobacteriota bacterium]
MSSLLPESLNLRKAIQWISTMKGEKGREASLLSLIDQACIRFNLAPKDCEFLHRFFAQQNESNAQNKD